MPPKEKVLTVAQRIRAIANSTNVSLIPQPREMPAPPPEKEEETIPQVSEIIKDAKTKLELARLVARHGEIGDAKRPLEKEQKALTEKIKKIVGKAQIGKAICGDWRINYYNAPKKYLDIEKLKALGLTLTQINDCYSEKPSYTLRITAEGSEDEDEAVA